jgi:hypothetical protein
MKTREDAVRLLHDLQISLRQAPEDWENSTLDRYLEAMTAWLESGGMQNTKTASWDLVCDMLSAGKIYE